MKYAEHKSTEEAPSEAKDRQCRVGLITIGQSPRTDITDGFRDALEPCDVDIVEAGVLDGLTLDQVRAKYWPSYEGEGETIYVSRMRDGMEVKLLKNLVYVGVQQRISELEAECDLVVVLCTGTFDGLRSSVPVVFPDEVLHRAVRKLGIAKRLHIVGPAAEQKPFLTAKWSDAVDKLTFTISSPYQDFHLDSVVSDIGKNRPEGVVLDCMGYRSEHKSSIVNCFLQTDVGIDRGVGEEVNQGDVPVILPQEAVAEYVLGVLARDQEEVV